MLTPHVHVAHYMIAWSYDQKYQKFSDYCLYFSSFNGKHLKSINKNGYNPFCDETLQMLLIKHFVVVLALSCCWIDNNDKVGLTWRMAGSCLGTLCSTPRDSGGWGASVHSTGKAPQRTGVSGGWDQCHSEKQKWSMIWLIWMQNNRIVAMAFRLLGFLLWQTMPKISQV